MNINKHAREGGKRELERQSGGKRERGGKIEREGVRKRGGKRELEKVRGGKRGTKSESSGKRDVKKKTLPTKRTMNYASAIHRLLKPFISQMRMLN